MAERTEQFSLRWNNFHSNLTAGFHELLQASEMVDVTLAVEGHLFQAHKLVLSICSPYFKEIFKTIPCKHPVVILKDVSHENIKDIIEFMYMGEVNVLRENLSAFLRTAEHLQVKGLTGDDSSETSSRKEDKPDSVVDQDEEQDLMQFNHIIDSDVELPASYNSPIVPTPAMTPQLPQNPQNKRNGKASQANATTKRPKIETIARKSPNSKNDNELSKNWSHSDESEVLDTKIIKSEQNDEGDVEGMKQLIDNNLGNPVLNDQSEQDVLLYSVDQKGHVYCPYCCRKFVNRYNLKVHIRDKHEDNPIGLNCRICGKVMRNPSCLRVHMYHHRKQRRNDDTTTETSTSLNI